MNAIMNQVQVLVDELFKQVKQTTENAIKEAIRNIQDDNYSIVTNEDVQAIAEEMLYEFADKNEQDYPGLRKQVGLFLGASENG